MPENYVAVIDIGSNAVRLVVYDGLNRAPFKIHSERTVCNLGADLATTGRLNPEAVEKSLNSLRRFSGLLAAMKIKNVHAVATAAVRDATDGKDFVENVRKEFNFPVRVIDGAEEARLSAQGVLANSVGDNSGIIGDYGGGSLELIVVENNQVRQKASLPLGSHRLLAENSRAAQAKTITTLLENTGFLQDHAGCDFYALGGAWRSLAKAHIHMARHPLNILDHYQVDGKKAAGFAALIARQSNASLAKTAGVSQSRTRDMGVAALTMELLFEKIRPRRLIFSATGLREGLLFDRLPPAVRQQDPLIAGCMKIAVKISRFQELKAFKVLFNWMEPLFAAEDENITRLLEASCLLSDSGWFEHEDYQADHAFRRVLALPFYGIDHAGRAFLALSQYVRYQGALGVNDTTGPAETLLDEKTVHRAVIAGLAQHLGYLLTGGALDLLRGSALRLTQHHLILKLDGQLNAAIIGETLRDLAKAMGREAMIED